jgi:TIR domain-containing protein
LAALDPVTFISYSREDAVFALRLAQDLKAAGARVWLDQLDIVPGHEWDSAVEEALVNSPRMLLILSPASSKSGNVRNEIHFAMNYGKIIIPVLYQPCVAPLALQRIQHVDFTGNYERALGILTTQLKTMPPKQAVAPLAEPEPEVALEPPQKPIAAPAIENPAGVQNSTPQLQPAAAIPAAPFAAAVPFPSHMQPAPQPIHIIPLQAPPPPDAAKGGMMGTVIILLLVVGIGYYFYQKSQNPTAPPAASTPAPQPGPTNTPPPNPGGGGDAAALKQQNFVAHWENQSGLLVLTTAKWTNNSTVNVTTAVVQCEQDDAGGHDLSQYRVTLNGPTPANTWSSYSNIHLGSVAKGMTQVNCTVVHIKE